MDDALSMRDPSQTCRGRDQFDPLPRRSIQFSFGKRPAEELYEIAADPDQVNNLASDPKYNETKQKLRGELDAYLASTNDPRMAGEEPWQDYVYHQTSGYGATYNKSLPEAERGEAGQRPGN